MYTKLTNGTPKNYSIAQLRRDNPQVSFSKDIPEPTLAEYSVYPLRPADQPNYDPATHRIEEGTPALIDGVWTQVWNVIALTAEEIAEQQAERVAQVEAQRAEAYRTESDPLFFKSQRGEATHQEWLDKVAEIKARYPNP
jgi:hypothetical protein